MAGRTTIRELARLSSVSVGTVSRALNGYPDVAAETRSRILRLATELEYTPAAAARTLATRGDGDGFADQTYLNRCWHHVFDEARRLARADVPCVGVDIDLGAESVFVASDDVAGAQMAVEHLYRLGHRRIATVTGPLVQSDLMAVGAIRAATAAGLRVPVELVEGDSAAPVDGDGVES